jgi:hypothetical protein
MSNRKGIQQYRSYTSGVKPDIDKLYDGEIALNLADEKMFFKNNSGTIAEFESIKNTQQKIETSINSKVFIGTRSEYDTAYSNGKISVGALVIILDENETNSDATTAMLGKAIIGTLLLGRV